MRQVKKLGIKIMIVAFACLLLSGCNTERERVSMQNNALSIRFEKLMESGQTTRDQEQAYIKATSNLSLQLDRSIRGTAKANETRQNASIQATTGIDPTQPVKLNRSK